jgi:hypothetical protein
VAPCASQRAQKIQRRFRRLFRPVLGKHAPASTTRRDVLAQKLAGARLEKAHAQAVPLHVHGATDPTGWRVIVAGVDLDAAVQMHGAFAVLVVAGRARPAAVEGAAARQQTSLRPGAWSSRGPVCPPIARPSDPGTPALPRGSRSEDPRAACAACDRFRTPPCFCDPDRRSGTAVRSRQSPRDRGGFLARADGLERVDFGARRLRLRYSLPRLTNSASRNLFSNAVESVRPS